MLTGHFRITGMAVAQIFLLGAIGYFLARKNLLKEEGLNSLSRLVVEITLPVLIFCQLIKNFRFSLYPNWWVFPLISIFITAAGLALGTLFTGLVKGKQEKAQFLSLITFQNAGYLPLTLNASLLSGGKQDTMFIYLFLFLLGFNLIIWSFGAYMLTFARAKRFELGSVFSPPVAATIFGLLSIFLGINKFIPELIIRPLRMAGECTFPLAMFVVGASLAGIQVKKPDTKAIFLAVAAKLVILPALGLWLVLKLRLPELIGLLIIIQLAVPSANSLSLIIRHYKKEDLLISQGVLATHLVALITLPLFLSLYFALFMVK